MNAVFALSLLAANISSNAQLHEPVTTHNVDKHALQSALAKDMQLQLDSMKIDFKSNKPIELVVLKKTNSTSKITVREIKDLAE